jgi:hypothetical protein
MRLPPRFYCILFPPQTGGATGDRFERRSRGKLAKPGSTKYSERSRCVLPVSPAEL